MDSAFDALLLTRSGRLVLRPGAPPAAPPAAPPTLAERLGSWLQARVRPAPPAPPAPPPDPDPEERLRAVDLELAALGHVLDYRARAALGALDEAAQGATVAWMVAVLGQHLGAGQKHEPLFRRFPYDIPVDTTALWWQKFVGFYLQAPGSPCRWCGAAEEQFLLSPCEHQVCGRCFDGTSYSACPVCERQVDRRSPFFKPSPERPAGAPSPVPLRRVVLAGDPVAEAQALLAGLAARPQALSPDDVAALVTVVQAFGAAVLGWLPPTVPVRENVAHIVGTLLRSLPPEEVLRAATPWLRTATDLLRVLAVMSGADAGLQPQTRRVPVSAQDKARWHGPPRELAEKGVAGMPASLQETAARYPQYLSYWMATEISARRFKVAKLSRPLRRALLAWLDALPEASLHEDMMRHRAAWVGVGEVLHPGEHRRRYPRAAAAFQLVRGHGRFAGFASRAEALRAAGEGAALVQHLGARPGELWRRADWLLRTLPDPAPVVAALQARVGAASLPLLMTLRAHLAHRGQVWPVRVYFPKGAQFLAPSARDRRPPLPVAARVALLQTIDAELLARFARLPPLDAAVLDEDLRTVVVPFNERTAARAAVALPRGSRVALPEGERLRLFLHWCQPPGGEGTDIDLSVAFYDADWNHTAVCSFYDLNPGPLAQHSGDRRDAPHPDGASEFVDVDRSAAREAGHRYAVMVVNAYSGLPFSGLERGFAGVIRRTDADGPVFDAASVELRFDITGPNGVYAPLLVDLDEGWLFWADVSHKGELALNTVASANGSLRRLGPALLDYFGQGVRPSMFELGALHAAARCGEVWVRGAAGVVRYGRRPGEPALALLERLRAGAHDGAAPLPRFTTPVFAALLRGDLELPEGSVAWALFRQKLAGELRAADLLVVPAAEVGATG